MSKVAVGHLIESTSKKSAFDFDTLRRVRANYSWDIKCSALEHVKEVL